jgi:hypothetical protein
MIGLLLNHFLNFETGLDRLSIRAAIPYNAARARSKIS